MVFEPGRTLTGERKGSDGTKGYPGEAVRVAGAWEMVWWRPKR